MKLEQQVTSLELSKRLKELGAKQNAFWSWYETTDYDDTPRLNRSDEHYPVCNLPKQSFEEKYYAFTVAELGEMLQESPRAGITMAYNKVFNLIDSTMITPEGLVMCLMDVNIVAKMLIYLLENKLITNPTAVKLPTKQ